MPDLSQEFELWDAAHKTHRLWAKDATLWTAKDESEWLGWLTVVNDMKSQVGDLQSFAEDIRSEGFKHIVLLGMGGSSLCLEVLQETFAAREGFPSLHVLDSVDPSQILSFEKDIDLAQALVVVSSKSGTTLETTLLFEYFYEKIKNVVCESQIGSRFVAITDPGTSLEKLAINKKFRRVFLGVPSIGGRYSALSNFGMLPAALRGIDVEKILASADAMAHASSPSVDAQNNPGVSLGIKLGHLARDSGRDKLTFWISPKIAALGGWLEQLIAESTGKNGKGLIPIDRESFGAPREYGDDRIFVVIRLKDDRNHKIDDMADHMVRAGHPVINLDLADSFDLGAEFFRWEIATAVASSFFGVNPFDQPDVEVSKSAVRGLTEALESLGSLPQTKLPNEPGLKEFISQIQPHDYFNISAFIEMKNEYDEILTEIGTLVRQKKHVATCHGFGPRFLHSTGQAFKGGRNNGVFLQITCEDENDIRIPGRTITFGQVKQAQAQGDMQVLKERGRRILRIHMKGNLKNRLCELKDAVEKAFE